MAKLSTVIITCYKEDWERFVKDNQFNPYVKCVESKEYPLINIINIRWKWIKFFTKDDYMDDILNFFADCSYIITILDEDDTINREDNVKSDDEVSDFWDYAPQVELNIDF